MATMSTLHELLIDELNDIHSAERQLVQAFPKMIEGANSETLSQALAEHLVETEEHVNRLDEIFTTLERSPGGKKCLGMEGLLAEGAARIGDDGDPDVLDAGIIGAAQRVEHYEIAAYGTAIAHAEAMGHSEIAARLKKTLAEEVAADRRLTEIADGGINRLAATEFGEGETVES